jgi:hypothetical protein
MKLINIMEDKIDVDSMTEEQKKTYLEKPVDIVAVLSKNQYEMIRTGSAEIQVPYGVTMENRAGSRRLSFYCESREIAEDLTEGLDNSGIIWEEDNDEEVDLSDMDLNINLDANLGIINTNG